MSTVHPAHPGKIPSTSETPTTIRPASGNKSWIEFVPSTPLRFLDNRPVDAFFGAGAVDPVCDTSGRLTAGLGISGPESVNFDVYNFFAIQMPLAVVITYAIWLLIIIKLGPPGRLLTNTEIRKHRGGGAGPPRKLVRALIKIALHLTLIGLVVDAVFILRDQRERRSVSDILAGTMVTPRRR